MAGLGGSTHQWWPLGGSLVVALAGQVLHQQVVPIEFDAASNIVALTSTNALMLTIGAS